MLRKCGNLPIYCPAAYFLLPIQPETGHFYASILFIVGKKEIFMSKLEAYKLTAICVP
jgi:hypothetical protein